jgi:carbon monoxide dehydrogenase subunit G
VETTVTSERAVPAPPERVWAALVDPHDPASLQPEIEVGRTWGTPGTPGSGYVATARKGPVRFELEVEVVQARPLTEMVVVQRTGGRLVGTSRYDLVRSDGGTRVSVSTTCPGLAARLGRGGLRRSQDRWLARLADLRP